MYPCEVEPSVKMAKKLVTTRALPAGQVLQPEDITTKSPGDGLPPYEIHKLVGRALRQPVEAETTLTFELLEEQIPDIGYTPEMGHERPVDVA
jgi:N-acetylneuraminate synthase/sialic acid synthase